MNLGSINLKDAKYYHFLILGGLAYSIAMGAAGQKYFALLGFGLFLGGIGEMLNWTKQTRHVPRTAYNSEMLRYRIVRTDCLAGIIFDAIGAILAVLSIYGIMNSP